MGKASKLKRARQRETEIAEVACNEVDEIQSDSEEPSASGANAATEFMTRACKNENHLQAIRKKKDFRNLRGAVRFLYSKIFNPTAVESGDGATGSEPQAKKHKKTESIEVQVTNAITAGAFKDAASILRTARLESAYEPKLGTLQRWVRDFDLAGILLAQEFDDDLQDRLVAITELMRCVNNNETLATYDSVRRRLGERDEKKMPGHVQDDTEWVYMCKELIRSQYFDCNIDAKRLKCGGEEISSIDREDESEVGQALVPAANLCHVKSGKDRTPENLYDLNIWQVDATIERRLMPVPDVTTRGLLHGRDVPIVGPRKFVPQVPGAFAINNVLSREECRQMIKTADSSGYMEDEPAGGQPGDSQLAYTCVWLWSEKLAETIFNRIKQFLPATDDELSIGRIVEGDARYYNTRDDRMLAQGINRRARFYRYEPGRYYRPHIDGAWPASDFHDGKYIYDAHLDDTENRLSSRYTLLFYLNEAPEHEGGQTTYYTPSARGESHLLNCVRVNPCTGTLLVFPHGVCEAPLLHEGSPVIEGKKYVIRTEALYYEKP